MVSSHIFDGFLNSFLYLHDVVFTIFLRIFVCVGKKNTICFRFGFGHWRLSDVIRVQGDKMTSTSHERTIRSTIPYRPQSIFQPFQHVSCDFSNTISLQGCVTITMHNSELSGALTGAKAENYLVRRLRATPPVFAVGYAVVFEALACGYRMVPYFSFGLASRRCNVFQTVSFEQVCYIWLIIRQ